MSQRFPWYWLLLGGLAVLISWPVFQWTVCRVEVEPDNFLVVTRRWGTPLPAGEMVAPTPTHKGIQRGVLSEGTHFLNPIWYSYELHPVVKVPEKHCAVLVRNSGVEISVDRKLRAEFLARGPIDLEASKEPGERGIIEQVLGPGKYRLNPYVFGVEIVPAVEIQSQQVGVKVLRWGNELAPSRNNLYVVPDGQRGVQQSFVPSGTHYVNPYVTQIIPVDIRSHTVVFEDIQFPSTDGFMIEPRVQVRYRVVPEKAPEIFVMLSENGVLNQADESHEDQLKNPILQKVILPLIRGYVRVEGSKHAAREYISKPKEEANAGGKLTNPRERLQEELMDKVRPECEKIGVIVDYIAVGQPQMNSTLEELANQIRDREQARIARKTNEQKVLQFTEEATLKSTEAMSEQRKKMIDANGSLERTRIETELQLENEEARLQAELASAQALLDGARKRAEAILTAGKADAAVVTADNKALVIGLQTAIGGFGSADAFAEYHILQKLSPVLSEIFASDTSEFAQVFSRLLSGNSSKTPVADGEPNRPSSGEKVSTTKPLP